MLKGKVVSLGNFSIVPKKFRSRFFQLLRTFGRRRKLLVSRLSGGLLFRAAQHVGNYSKQTRIDPLAAQRVRIAFRIQSRNVDSCLTRPAIDIYEYRFAIHSAHFVPEANYHSSPTDFCVLDCVVNNENWNVTRNGFPNQNSVTTF